MILNKQKSKIFSEKILLWYSKFGRKDLPWQINNTPYATWISEIMLQQTKSINVIPYFKNFIFEFPTVEKLANASLDKILHFWSGLGYYNRAKNLHKTSKIIVEKYKGYFPIDLELLQSFPGIGRSTASAILSLSNLEKSYCILDANVKRILTRYYNIEGYPSERRTEKKLWKKIEQLSPTSHVKEFNQGLMDLGYEICVPRKPKCQFCPIQTFCKSNILKNWENYPRKKMKKKYQKKKIWYLILEKEKKVWLEKSSFMGYNKDLFCFPYFNSLKELNIFVYKKISITCKYEVMSSIKHTIDKIYLNIIPIFLSIQEKKNLFFLKSGIWFDLHKPQLIGFSSPIKHLVSKIKNKI